MHRLFPDPTLAAALLASALTLVCPRPAAAQATDIDVQLVTSGTIDGKVNREECEADQELAVTWSLTGTPTSDQTVRIFTDTSSGCSSQVPLASLHDGPAVEGEQTVTLRVRSDLHGGECPSDEDHDRFVCFSLDGGGLKEPVRVALAVTFDTMPPSDPSVTVQSGDGSLHLAWAYEGSADPDVDGYRAAWRVATSTDPSGVQRSDTLSTSATTFAITGLENGTEYEVWVETRDDFGNWSSGSTPLLATPRASDDFWEHYRGAGGAEQGCGQRGAGGPAWVLVLLGVLWLGIRRRWVRALVASALFLVAGGVARADEGLVEPDRGWIVDFELGPYYPEVDAETQGATPYADVFGSGQTLLFDFHLERALWQGVGQVDLGFGAGFGQDVGKGVYPDGTPSPDTTVFNWVPFDLTLAYRFDWAAQRWGLPLVPYGRVGLVWDLWWILDGTGKVAVDADGVRAQGGRWGWEAEAGVQLLLDALDPMLAKDFQRSSGVDNTYLFFAYRRLQIDGFGKAGFNLSDTTWSLGLAIEF